MKRRRVQISAELLQKMFLWPDNWKLVDGRVMHFVKGDGDILELVVECEDFEEVVYVGHVPMIDTKEITYQRMRDADGVEWSRRVGTPQEQVA